MATVPTSNKSVSGSGNTPMLITPKSQAGVIAYFQECAQLINTQWNLRENMREIDLQYIREKNWTVEQTRAKTANRYGDSTKYQDITIPVVMPAVEAAVEYQTDVFLTGEPLFPVVSDPQFVDQALALEAILDDHAIRGGWARHLMMCFRDAFKYNFAFCELDWESIQVPSFETDPTNGKGKPKETVWSGNVAERWDPYNTFWDTRFPVSQISTHGEFIGRTEIFSRIGLKQFISDHSDFVIKDNIKAAFASGTGIAGSNVDASAISRYYLPPINPSAMLDKNPKTYTVNWLAWAGASGADKINSLDYKNIYEVTTLYGRILPSDFDFRVPSRNTPQVWKFVIINGQVVLYAERQTNAHNRIPVLGMCPLEDGLSYQTKTFAQNQQPVQEISTAAMSSVMASRRRAISDRTIFDPSRISEAHINSDNPSAKIPMRPTGYGKNPGESVYAFPYRDDQSQYILQMMPFFMSLGDKMSGQNPTRQGQFVKGNKSRKEFETTMDNSTNPDQQVAILFETQFFTPFKEMAKLNILQYQEAGNAYSRKQQQQVQINPVELRKAAYNFKVADGQRPSSKIMNDDSWQVTIQSVTSSPQLMSGYNVTPMFSYLMKSRGADVSPFEKSPQQIAYEQAMDSWRAVAEIAAKSGQPIPAQPVPQQYNYIPGATPQQEQQAQQQQAGQNG